MKPAAGSASSQQLTTHDWTRVVIVAGIGTVLDWYDMNIYSQLDTALKAAFFTSETAYWAVFGAAMAARPIGALLFGHIGDTAGRGRALILGVVVMAVATCAISILPTNDVGPYTAGAAAPVLLGIFRVLQGLALGGEYAAALVLVSEMALPQYRALLTALVQSMLLLGLALAVALVMILQATISSYDMIVWGWRIPFALSSLTALFAVWLRRGMPEPHAFLHAMRAARHQPSTSFSKRQLTLLGGGAEWEAADGEAAKSTEEGSIASKATTAAEPEARTAAEARGEVPFERAASVDRAASRLGALQGVSSSSKIPILRAIKKNPLGVVIQIACTAWVACAYYATTTWLPSKLRGEGYMSVRTSQGILLASIPPAFLGYLSIGWLLDRGWRAVYINMAMLTVAAGAAFGTFYGSFNSTVAAWLLSVAMLSFIGAALAVIGFPFTRLYGPLERVTCFAFGFNMAMGVLGGFTPNICNAIKSSISSSLEYAAAPFWLVGMAALSLAGCVALLVYAPRLNQPYVGRLE